MPDTRDNAAARDEDQMSPERGKMTTIGGKGPTAASAADTQGAFGDAEERNPSRDRSTSSTGDSLSEGPLVFEETAKDE